MSAGMHAVGDWALEELEMVERCPVCGESRRSILYEGLTNPDVRGVSGSWSFHRCFGCRSAYLDPRPTEATIARAYDSYYTHDDPPVASGWPCAPLVAGSLGRFRTKLDAGYLNAHYGYNFRPALRIGSIVTLVIPRARARADRWARHLPRPLQSPSLLDVGFGRGDFLVQMRAAGWSVAGVDPDLRSVTRAARAGLEVREGRLDDDTFAAGRFDAVTLSHVIEHLHDPLGTLRICRQMLKPGGLVWIATPNLDSRGHAVFRRHWIGLDPPRHLVLFTPTSLRSALRRAGFDVVREPVKRVASWTFKECAALEQGRDPFSDPAKLSTGMAVRARMADLQVLLGRPVHEEIVMLAQLR